MSDVARMFPDVIAASAAVIAAVLSGVTLWVTGRRSETAWIRSALVDALERFAQSSFDRRRAAREVMESRREGSAPATWAALQHDCRESHRAQSDCLTRLRLLAADAVVQAAEDLAVHDYQLEQLTLTTCDAPTASDEEQWEHMRQANDAVKRKFVLAARQSLRIRGGKEIDPRMLPAVGRSVAPSDSAR